MKSRAFFVLRAITFTSHTHSFRAVAVKIFGICGVGNGKVYDGPQGCASNRGYLTTGLSQFHGLEGVEHAGHRISPSL